MADKPEQSPSFDAAPTETGAPPPRKLTDFTSSRKDTPPRPTPRRPGPKPSGPAATPRSSSLAPGVIHRGMAGIYASLGMFAGAVDPIIGSALVENADRMGAAWEKVAAESDMMREIAEKLLAGSTWSEFFIAHVPLGIAVKASVDARRQATRERREAAEAEATNGFQVPPPNVKRSA